MMIFSLKALDELTCILRRDYAPNELLDRYSEADIDDEFEELSGAARRAAEVPFYFSNPNFDSQLSISHCRPES
jgi:hypothetical protein